MKRISWALALLLLAALLCATALAEEKSEYQTLKVGDKGQAVLDLKQRMYELGYFTSTKFSNEFNATTRERVIELQKKNGLEADGIATPEVQALIFSDDCLPRSATPRPKAKSTPAPTAAASSAAPQTSAVPSGMTPPAGAPALDDEGFLPEGSEPYTHADRDKGVWSYISPSIHIEIRRYTAAGPRMWLEASIRLRNSARLTSLLSSGKKPGNARELPSKILKDNGGAIFAFNDDFFGYRNQYHDKVGVIVRNGEILYDQTRKSGSAVFPPLDVMAVFQDGSMKTFDSDEHTAQEYIDMGVVDTYAFGPLLIREGQIDPRVKKYGTKSAPRLAFGITADGTIKVLDVLGRRKDAVGVTVEWVAEKMLEIGCVEALNLDGGGTTCMIFLGDMINRPANTSTKDIRYVSGLIGIREEE